MDELRPRAPGHSDQGKIVSAAEAVALIRNGDAVATSGFVGIGFAEVNRPTFLRRLHPLGDWSLPKKRGGSISTWRILNPTQPC